MFVSYVCKKPKMSSPAGHWCIHNFFRKSRSLLWIYSSSMLPILNLKRQLVLIHRTFADVNKQIYFGKGMTIRPLMRLLMYSYLNIRGAFRVICSVLLCKLLWSVHDRCGLRQPFLDYNKSKIMTKAYQ